MASLLEEMLCFYIKNGYLMVVLNLPIKCCVEGRGINKLLINYPISPTCSSNKVPYRFTD